MEETPRLTRSLTLTLAIACGVSIANIYAPQVVVAPIAATLGLDLTTGSLLVTLFQVGYLIGLVLLVPVGDLLENRSLVLRTLAADVLVLVLAATAPSAWVFMIAALLIGVTTTAVQMLVPMAAHFAPEHQRGRMVGTVMSGLLLGAVLCRPFGTLIVGTFGWRAMFGVFALSTGLVALGLARILPRRTPPPGLTYRGLLASLWSLLLHTPVLQRRAAYHALLFAAFSIYWTAVAWELSGAPFHLGHLGIAVFMLSGGAGVFIAPLAGWAADEGHSTVGTTGAFALVAMAFVLAGLGAKGSLSLMVAAGIALDAGVQANLVLGQRAIYMLHSHTRSRLNGLYLAIFFSGGAVGSALAGVAYRHGGWATDCWLGLAFPILAFVLLLVVERGG
jgi:predicted MFS family arabinose efflux permease